MSSAVHVSPGPRGPGEWDNRVSVQSRCDVRAGGWQARDALAPHRVVLCKNRNWTIPFVAKRQHLLQPGREPFHKEGISNGLVDHPRTRVKAGVDPVRTKDTLAKAVDRCCGDFSDAWRCASRCPRPAVPIALRQTTSSLSFGHNVLAACRDPAASLYARESAKPVDWSKMMSYIVWSPSAASARKSQLPSRCCGIIGFSLDRLGFAFASSPMSRTSARGKNRGRRSW